MKKLLYNKLVAMPSPVWVIGTYDSNNNANLMPLSWGSIASTEPPCISISVNNIRQTKKNIDYQGCFTVSVPSYDQIKIVDRLAMSSGRNVNKFSQEKLQMICSTHVNAPYAREFPLILACKLIQHFNIGSHTNYIGKIMVAIAEPTILDEKDSPIMQKLQPIISSAAERSYYRIGEYIAKAYEIGNVL